jgi:hypothetical protein
LLSDGSLSPEVIAVNRHNGFDVINTTYYPFIAGLAINAFVYATDEGRVGSGFGAQQTQITAR